MFVSHAFITYKNKILLFHRDNKPTIKDPDCWDIIGGHNEESETPDQTLIREIHEEIGITPSLYKQLFSEPDVWQVETYIYHIQLTDTEAQQMKLGDEGQEIKLFTFEELNELKLTQNLTKYLKNYSSLIKERLTT
jgi:8-oxo-dGTP diphosphatase